jgi:hypothetical protein
MLINSERITLPLTAKIKGVEIVPQRSGLNWGQRPGREPNQAYLSVPVDIQRSGFFPDRGEEFLIECDDGEVMKCVRAQQNGKAIETSGNNAILGLYFRKRLNVRSGYMVTIDHLYRYGRISVDFSYINEYKYFLDFSTLKKTL